MELSVESLKTRIESAKEEQDALSARQRELSYQIIVDKLITRVLEDTISIIDKSTGQVLGINEL